MFDKKARFNHTFHGIEATISLLAEVLKVPNSVVRATVCDFLSGGKRSGKKLIDDILNGIEVIIALTAEADNLEPQVIKARVCHLITSPLNQQTMKQFNDELARLKSPYQASRTRIFSERA